MKFTHGLYGVTDRQEIVCDGHSLMISHPALEKMEADNWAELLCKLLNTGASHLSIDRSTLAEIAA